mgnify:CR=1 FL=1
MRRLTRTGSILGALTAVALFSVAAAPVRVSSTSLEMRAMWVPRSALTSPGSISLLVRSAQASGFNALFVQVRGRGEALYRSARRNSIDKPQTSIRCNSCCPSDTLRDFKCTRGST